MRRSASIAVVFALAAAAAVLDPRARLIAQRGGMFLGSTEDPAIAYSTAPLSNAVSEVNAKLRDGRAHLTFDGRSGYLRAALDLPVDCRRGRG